MNSGNQELHEVEGLTRGKINEGGATRRSQSKGEEIQEVKQDKNNKVLF